MGPGLKDVKLRKSVKWWDLDNVTDFFHTLGYSATWWHVKWNMFSSFMETSFHGMEVFILSMPLVGVNFMSQRSSNWTDHWWFQNPGCTKQRT